jgi:hypothetical protein
MYFFRSIFSSCKMQFVMAAGSKLG